MPSIIDLTGKQFGRLTVTSYHGPHECGEYLWKCRCVCGTECIKKGVCLRNGLTKSCGCFRDETRKASKLTHGKSGSSEYRVWAGMKARCINPNTISYKNYGGKGISVCQRWLDSFTNFFDDMGPRPSAKHQIDRIDGTGNYEPGNCRWVTPKEQQRNRNTNHRLTCHGETLTVSEWAERLNVDPKRLYCRLARGWSDEEIITRPLRLVVT